jgi:hypothetical protein
MVSITTAFALPMPIRGLAQEVLTLLTVKNAKRANTIFSRHLLHVHLVLAIVL